MEQQEAGKQNNLSIWQIVFAIAVLGVLFLNGINSSSQKNEIREVALEWGTLGSKLIQAGVIDKEKFLALYEDNISLKKETKDFLESENNTDLIITKENSPLVLNLLWALGLGNKNPILANGPMVERRYGGAGGFASTGGWTLSLGNTMNHYGEHVFIVLDDKQQKMVERVSKNVYRPCCDNPAHFPDCNHGMAMLGLLEILARGNATEEQMYNIALLANTLWFPEQYATIDKYIKLNKILGVNAKKILSADYSSASGYRAIERKMRVNTENNIKCNA